MATYEELFDLRRDEALLDKVTTAVVISAETIFAGDDSGDPPWDAANHANRVIWAREAIKRPRDMAGVVIGLVISANKAATAGNISGATDAAIQSNVDAIVDTLADGTAVLD